MDRGRVCAVLLLAGLAAGCFSEAPASIATPAPSGPAIASHRSGEPLSPGVRPTAAECRQHLTADTGAAKLIRSELAIDGLPSTDIAILAAAADPGADIATLGIPITVGELEALRASGTFVDRSSPLRFWVQGGASERFGGIWIDPPGSGRFVVGILDTDPSALALARCLDTGLDVRYVAARSSLADDNALQARISADLSQLKSSGIKVVSVGIGVRAAATVVVIGVTGVTDEIRANLVARYGDTIVVEEQSPIVAP